MTVQTIHAENTFTGDGSQLSFNFTFAVIVDNPQLEVLIDNALPLSSFEILPNSNQVLSPGGTILFDSAPALNAAGIIRRKTSPTQEVGFTREGKIPTDKLAIALDKTVLITQELRRDLSKNTFRWLGDWDIAATYQPGDAVSHEGTSYIALNVDTTSEPPSADWNILSAKGDTGDQGEQGIQGDQGIQGEQGIQGIQGEQGVQGVPGNDGADGRSFVWKGAWSGVTAYAVDDVVSSGGSSYICILAHTNHVPPNATYWGLMSQKGDQGVQGIQGDQGIQGIQGDPGADGADGADGVINQLQLGGSNVTTQPILNFDDTFFDVDNAGGKNTVTFVGDTVSGTTNEIDVTAGVVGLADNAVLPGTAGVVLPTGNTSQRGGSDGMIRYNSQTKQIEGRCDNLYYELTEVSVIKKAIDNRSNNTLTDDTELKFSVDVNEYCIFEVLLLAVCANNTPDLKFALSLPSGAVATYTESDGGTIVSNSTSVTVQLVANVAKLIVLKGSIYTPIAGNVVLQTAQNTTNGNVVQILPLSYIKKTHAR